MMIYACRTPSPQRSHFPLVFRCPVPQIRYVSPWKLCPRDSLQILIEDHMPVNYMCFLAILWSYDLKLSTMSFKKFNLLNWGESLTTLCVWVFAVRQTWVWCKFKCSVWCLEGFERPEVVRSGPLSFVSLGIVLVRSFKQRGTPFPVLPWILSFLKWNQRPELFCRWSAIADSNPRLN